MSKQQQSSSHTVNLDELSSSSVETTPQNVHADEAQQQRRNSSNSSTLSKTVSDIKHDHGKKAHKYLVRDESMTMGTHNAQHAEASTSASASATTTTTKTWVKRASSSLGNTLVRHSHIILPTLVVLFLVAAVVLFSLGLALRNAYAPHVPPDNNNNNDTHSSNGRHNHHSNDNSDNNGHRGDGDDNCSHHHHSHHNHSDRYTDYDSSSSSSSAPMPVTMTPYKDSSSTIRSSSSSNTVMHSSSAMLPYPDMPSSSDRQHSDKDDHDDDDDRDDYDDDDDRDDDERDKYYLDGMCSCTCTRARCCRNFGFQCPSDKRYCDRYNTYCTCNCSPRLLWDKRPRKTGCREKYKHHVNMCKAPYPFQDHNQAMCKCNCELVDDNFTTCVHACRCKY